MNIVVLVSFFGSEKIWGQVGPLIGPGVFFLMYLAFLMFLLDTNSKDKISWHGQV